MYSGQSRYSRNSRTGRRPIRGPIGLLIAGGGLAAEAIQHQREKSKAKGKEKAEAASSLEAYPESPPNEYSSQSHPQGRGVATERRHSWDGAPVDDYPSYDPPPYSESDRSLNHATGLEKYNYEHVDPEPRGAPAKYDEELDESDIDDADDADADEVLWNMDDASREVHPTDRVTRKADIPKGLAKEPASIGRLVEAFLAQNPSQTPPPASGQADLPNPVMIPQRRPASRTRGFVRAYAPALEPCGISQDAFLHFLDYFDASLEYSNVIKAVFVGAGIVGLVPGLTTMIISNSLQAAAVVAGNVQSRTRNNDFISRINSEYFIPRGLVCVIMKYKNNSLGTVPTPDLNNATSRATASSNFNLHGSHGIADDRELPAPADLIFPDLETGHENAGRFIRSVRFVRDYSDRRAHAQFAMENPDSLLAEKMAGRTTFESSWGDPRHMAEMRDQWRRPSRRSRGGYDDSDEQQGMGFVSGRRQRRQVRKADRRAAIVNAFRGDHDDTASSSGHDGSRLAVPDEGTSRRRARSLGHPITPQQQRNLEQYSLRRRLRAARTPDVLYMMIVPMPSGEELARAEAGPKQDIEVVDTVVS